MHAAPADDDAQSETQEVKYDKDGRRVKLTYANDSCANYH